MPSSGIQLTRIVGRDREQAALVDQLAEAVAGRGSLALVSGDAGIGKTALIREFSSAAVEQDCLVLTGACYDAGTTPPYGPWSELVASAARRDERLPAPPLLEQAPTPHAFVADLRDYLQALAGRGPLVLVLEDLHWADHESLEFLRLFVRRLDDLPLLLVATYRDDELTDNHMLDRILPHLVRESNALRLNLAPLDEPAVQTLIEQRYGLSDADLARLSVHVGGRSQGVPLYLLELLRSLEEQQRLRRTADGWELGEIDKSHVPALVRQVIDGRIERLGPDVRRLLELAAVVGQDVPLLLWRRVSGVTDDIFDEAVERALDAHVLDEVPSGMRLQFTHALVRDALYAGIALPRRQRWHRQVAEALASEAGVEPDSVAHHFRQALDTRAIDWFIRAGSRAERAAWPTAARHFEAALAMMASSDAPPNERGWLLLRRARLLRVADQRTALALLDAAATLAEDTADAVLQAYVKFLRGQVGMVAGGGRAAMANLEARVVEFARLSPADVTRVEEIERQAVFPSRTEMDGHMGGILAAMGRIDEALTHTQATIERTDGIPDRAWWGRGIALANAGRVGEAREAYTIARNECLRVSDLSSVAMIYLYQISTVELPYGTDNLVERSRIAREAEAAWQRVGGALGDATPRTAWLPFLQIEGEWASARALALSGIRPSDATSERDLILATVLAQLAGAQGDVALAWELVYALLPSGPHAVPGYTEFRHALPRMRIAAGLCLDHNDLPAAHAWLDAHDRWLAWSGAVLGRADGECAWAEYCLAAGEIGAARQHASQGLALASEPRQPLALLAAHRLLGTVETHAGRLLDARQHLDAALVLADACAAPYERALTMLACADLALRAGANDEAGTALDEARAICTPLAAAPALARIDALAARLGDQSSAMQRTAPVGLSPREIEVLRLLAGGRTNREIAESLFLSSRTVERHITNLYAKIGA
ncbi:MAG TPA: BREX system ATP-binding domain-containing protein, partial [Thermomicrobiales bacterium]|nr:BREX system ATP-binding domain-containing protein [Thermomicrobiales bacterium]